MSNPVQVDAPFLDRLIRLGSSACQGLKVYGDNELNGSDKANSAGAGPITPSSAATTDTKQGEVKKGFEPQRKYYMEGRIIHKRKLSKRLFFLDVSLVRHRHQSGVSKDIPAEQGVASRFEATAGESTTESGWEYVETPIDYPVGDGQPQNTQYHRRMEIIARFPTHSLKELDDLWRRVQLGAVVRVFGDIEISEKKKSTATMTNRWSALLHCLDFEVLELWRGKDAFEPNPGSAEISNGVITGQNAAAGGGGSKASGKKRKSSEMSEDSSESQQQQRGDDSQPHCKFWLNSGKCSKGVCEFWHETDPVKLKTERRRWVDEVSITSFVSDCRGCQRALFIGNVVLIDNGNLFHATIANPSEEANLTSCLGPAPKNDQEPTSGTSTLLCKVADRHVHTPVLECRFWSA